MDVPADYGRPCPSTPQDMNRRFILIQRLRLHPDFENTRPGSPSRALSAVHTVIHREIAQRANETARGYTTELVTVIPSQLGRAVRYAVRVERTA
jgi:hypothetical protein